MNKPERRLKLQIMQSMIAVFTVMAIVGTLFCASAFAGEAPHEGETVEAEISQTKADVMLRYKA